MEVLEPRKDELEGEDLVGVLIVYQQKEHYMYNVLSNADIFSKHKTNATYFQVASFRWFFTSQNEKVESITFNYIKLCTR